MYASTIAKLAWYMPRRDAPAGTYVLPDSLGVEERTARNIMHYAYCHRDLEFGWSFVNHLKSMARTHFPAFLHGQDLFLWRAYKFQQGYYDPVIAGALAYKSEAEKLLRETMHSALTSSSYREYMTADPKNYIVEEVKRYLPEFRRPLPNIYRMISEKTGVPLHNVIAYEKLFFNVVDRAKDHEYIARIVYPEGRMVEGMKDYLEKTTTGQLLMRMAYNKDPNFAFYMVGIGDHPYKMYDASMGALEFDKMVLQDGMLFAAAGFMNAEDAIPIRNARLSIQAGKMGNNDQSEGTPMITLADIARAEMIRMSEDTARAMAAAQLEDDDLPPPNVTLELPKKS